MTTPPPSQSALEWIRAAERGSLGDRMGIEWLEATPERVVARMPVEGNTQPFGLLHGGASAVLAEGTGSVGANLHAGEGRYAVGVELSCSHHRGVRDGHVTATAVPLSVGRSLATFEIDVRDDAGRKVCTARLTCYYRDLERPAESSG